MPLPRYLTYSDRAYRREKVLRAWAQGPHYRGKSREVAERYGLSRNHVNTIIRDAGLRSRRAD